MAKQLIIKGTSEPGAPTDGFGGGTAITERASGNCAGGACRPPPPHPDDVGVDDPELMRRGNGGFLVFG